MSEVKVNKISPRTACGTVTLGDSGDTFTIPAGATINNQGTAVNFGATGSASWVTTVKTTGFTAVAGEGYFCNTTSGGFSVNLPAGTAGAVVAIKDYAGTFDTGTLTLVQNGSDKIGGSTINATLTTEGIAVTLVFIDSTQGWLVTDSGLQDEAPTNSFITATGGTPSQDGDYEIRTFTGPGTFCVSALSNNPTNNLVDYIVVAGGGGGSGACIGGAGGAGGFRASATTFTNTGPGSPRTSGVSALPVSVQGYTITVGGGGPAGVNNPNSPTNIGTPGTNSTFSTIISAGGGGGGGNPLPAVAGGSGGGGSDTTAGGAGNTPPVSPPQGSSGGAAGGGTPAYGASGGGGAMAVGDTGTPSKGGNGGAGAGLPTTAFGSNGVLCGSYRYYSGGGGGAGEVSSPTNIGTGGVGGGGNGGFLPNPANGRGIAGTANTGGGAGGTCGPIPASPLGGSGGSGIVIIRYKFQ